MHRVARVLGAIVLVVAPLLLTVDRASTQQITCSPPTPPADFLTGGGFILVAGDHGNFGVGGGCKAGGDGHGLWGHLEYIDHGIALDVHWTTITAYMNDPFGDPNARLICGTATTNDPSHPNVDFAVRAADDDKSGTTDTFDIRLTDTSVEIYSTFGAGFPHMLAGGNITLHLPNPSITGSFNESCPAAPGGIIM